MSVFVNKLVDDDFVWKAITENLPGRVTKSNTGYLNIDCPMCISRGESRDTKQRCGIIQGDGIGVSCFNCGFATRYKQGEYLSVKMRDFLIALGVDSWEVSQMVLRAAQLARIVSDSGVEVVQRDYSFTPRFSPIELPEDSYPIREWRSFGADDPDFNEVAAYADSRGEYVANSMLWSPAPRWRRRMIIPFRFRGEVVGLTGRSIDPETDENPRYLNDQVPADFLYNGELLNGARDYVIMPEGVLDAHVIEGISPLGARMSPRQLSWIKESGKKIIVVPDPDGRGGKLIDVAVENDWAVAFPKLTRAGNNWWEQDCKDCAEAVKRYGRLYTLRSIFETATTNKTEIAVRRKWL